MISDFKIGDFVGIDNPDFDVVGQVVGTPDTDYSIGEGFVKVLWDEPGAVPTPELSENLTKLDCEDIPEETE